MAIDYTALKTEINADPLGVGYAARLAVGDDTGVAALLSAVRAGQNCAREPITSAQLFSAISPNDFGNLSPLQLQQLQVILSMPTINLADASTRAILRAVFAGFTTTLASLAALVNRQGSRAEVLFGAGTAVSASDVARALRG